MTRTSLTSSLIVLCPKQAAGFTKSGGEPILHEGIGCAWDFCKRKERGGEWPQKKESPREGKERSTCSLNWRGPGQSRCKKPEAKCAAGGARTDRASFAKISEVLV